MSKDLNKVQLTGRLGADPEMRFTPQGHAVTTFRVASNCSWRTAEGEAHEDTEWFRVVAWNKLAEICNQWLSKGSRVYVEGRMQTRQWQDQDGQSRSSSEVIASDMIILDTRRDFGPRAARRRRGRAGPRANRFRSGGPAARRCAHPCRFGGPAARRCHTSRACRAPPARQSRLRGGGSPLLTKM